MGYYACKQTNKKKKKCMVEKFDVRFSFIIVTLLSADCNQIQNYRKTPCFFFFMSFFDKISCYLWPLGRFWWVLSEKSFPFKYIYQFFVSIKGFPLVLSENFLTWTCKINSQHLSWLVAKRCSLVAMRKHWNFSMRTQQNLKP